MMAEKRTLILLRHAKSSWKDSSLNDIQRPLNKRGNRDAPKMGEHMAEQNILPEVIFSSPGLRALTTARLISVKIGIEPSNIKVDDNIYTFNFKELLGVIKSLDEGYNKVLIVGHNPAITDLTNYLSGSKIDNVPTCGLAVVEFSGKKWTEVSKKDGKLSSFDYPKKLW